MQTTQSAQPWLGSFPTLPESETESPDHARPEPARVSRRPDHEGDAHREVARLRIEIEQLVQASADTARDVVDNALESVTRLQIVTANMDACRPPSAAVVGAALVALADAHLRGHSDAIERGMAYTADNQIRLLLGDK